MFFFGHKHYFSSQYSKYVIYCCSFGRTQRETIAIGNNAGHILIRNKTGKSNGTVVLIIVALLSNGRNYWSEPSLVDHPSARPFHRSPLTSGITCPTLSLYVVVNYFSNDMFSKRIINKSPLNVLMFVLYCIFLNNNWNIVYLFEEVENGLLLYIRYFLVKGL